MLIWSIPDARVRLTSSPNPLAASYTPKVRNTKPNDTPHILPPIPSIRHLIKNNLKFCAYHNSIKKLQYIQIKFGILFQYYFEIVSSVVSLIGVAYNMGIGNIRQSMIVTNKSYSMYQKFTLVAFYFSDVIVRVLPYLLLLKSSILCFRQWKCL